MEASDADATTDLRPAGTVMRVLSVNVGLPRDVEWNGRRVRTSIWKSEVRGRRWVGRLNVAGDAQADLAAHGGEHRAVYVYDTSAYGHWERVLGRSDFVRGQFGENFTVEGLPDDEVCVGDRYRIGGALFEVTQPRVTCHKVGLRMREPRMPALLYSHGRPGFYLRVLEEGEVGAGDPIERVGVGPGAMAVREVSALLYLPGATVPRLERAMAIPALSEGWRRSFEALRAQVLQGASGNRGLAPPSGGPPAWAGLRPFRIAGVARESRSIASFVLEPVDGEPLPAFRPGQFLTVRVRPAGAPRPLLRSFSLSAAPDGRRYRLSVKREPGGVVSAHLHDRIGPGDVIEVGAPRGTFTLDRASGEEPVVLLSAGVGATPVLAMLASLAAAGGDGEVWWIHGARNGAEHAFAREARRHLAALSGARSHVRYSRPDATDVAGRHYDAQGRIGVDVLAELGVPRAADFYLCGPRAWMRELSAGLLAWGAAPERINAEIFGSEPLEGAERPPHPPPGEPGTGPEVAFTTSGLTVRWHPAYGSLLELAEACDVPVGWSCRAGACHSCECGLVDGEVAYLPEPLEPPEDGRALICCSRPVSDVALEL
jgi:ferredoxin-NADP reductase/MOSC domain-containing protein YiiM